MTNQYLVIYRRQGGGVAYQEYTSNLTQTLAMLEAQGFIIVDVIDL